MSAPRFFLGLLAYVAIMVAGGFLFDIDPTFAEAMLVVVATMSMLAVSEVRP